MDLETIPRFLSVFAGFLFLVFTALSLYFFNERVILIGSNSVLLPIIYLIFAISYPQNVYFSGVSVASLFVAWSIYYTLFSRKGFKELFMSGFLISIAALFDPHITLIIPLILFFSLRTASVNARTVIVVSCSLIIPFAVVFALRYFVFEDIDFLTDMYLKDITSIWLSGMSTKNSADIIKIVSLFIYLLLSVSYAVKNINRYKILKSYLFLRFISLLIITSLVLFFYPQSGEELMQIISIPASVLVLEYISSTEKPIRKRVGFLLVLIFMIMSRIAAFI